MEKYVTKCRLILICENLGNLIPALLSRCFLIRCRAPTNDDICAGLVKITEHEGMKIEQSQLNKILQEPSRNMRRAIMSLQNHAIKAKASKQLGSLVDWRDSIKSIVTQITKAQTPAVLKAVRCYDLLVNCINPGLIIRELVNQLIPVLQEEYIPHLLHWAAYYEAQIHHSSKDLPCIEAFLARTMVILAEQRTKTAPNNTELGLVSN